jgi:mRNA interferase MazF
MPIRGFTTRPYVVISPDEMNRHIGTVIVALMSTRGRPYPSRVPVTFQGRSGLIVLDQIRTVDKSRLVQLLGEVDDATAHQVLAVLGEMFAP